MSAAAARLAPSVLREALLAGAGDDRGVLAAVGLLDAAGLLARTDLVASCVEVVEDEGGLWAALDFPQVQFLAWGGSALSLSVVERQALGLAVQLVDLAAVLRELDGPARVWADAAVSAVVAPHAREDVPPAAGADGVGPEMWVSPDGMDVATGPLARMWAAESAARTGGAL